MAKRRPAKSAAQRASRRRGRAERPLWRCPRCGHFFVTKNIWHSCGKFTVRGYLKGKSKTGVALFREFVRALKRCGPVRPSPVKTGVSYMVRMRFAGASVHRDELRVRFLLTRPLEHPRITRIEHIPPRYFVHTMRVTHAAEFDDTLHAWLAESYQMGCQAHVAPRRERVGRL